MLETSNLARKYTLIYSFRKYTVQCLAPLNFADVSIFVQKIMFFVQKGERFRDFFRDCVRDFLVLFEFFVRQKVTIPENIIFADSMSGICSKLAKNLKGDNDV